MFDQIKNRKEEKLYILTMVSTNDIMPYITVNTWEKCINKFEEFTKELDNASFLVQLIHKNISEETHTAEASMRRNNRGWGGDYFQYITIQPLYTEAW